MIFRDCVSRTRTEDQVDTLIQLALRERYGDAQPASIVWERIRDTAQSDLSRDGPIRLLISCLLNQVWLQTSGTEGASVHSHYTACDLRLVLVRQHPMNTRLVC